jgi:hypothetical protein
MYIVLLSSRIWDAIVKAVGGKPRSEMCDRKIPAKTSRYDKMDIPGRRF